MIHSSLFYFCEGVVSAGGDVSVHGFAAGPARSVEPAGAEPVRAGHHGCSMGKKGFLLNKSQDCSR